MKIERAHLRFFENIRCTHLFIIIYSAIILYLLISGWNYSIEIRKDYQNLKREWNNLQSDPVNYWISGGRLGKKITIRIDHFKKTLADLLRENVSFSEESLINSISIIDGNKDQVENFTSYLSISSLKNALLQSIWQFYVPIKVIEVKNYDRWVKNKWSDVSSIKNIEVKDLKPDSFLSSKKKL